MSPLFGSAATYQEPSEGMEVRQIVEVNADDTTLVITDPQNDFLSPERVIKFSLLRVLYRVNRVNRDLIKSSGTSIRTKNHAV